MWGLILQCLLSLLPISIAYYEKLKEFRKKDEAPKKEAKAVLYIVVVVSILSIALQVINYFDSTKVQKGLNDRFSKLDSKNDSLEKQIAEDAKTLNGHLDISTLKLSDQAAGKALQASRELKSTADSLKKIIVGSNIPPRVELFSGTKSPTFFFKNHDNLPVTFMSVIENYSNTEKCKKSSDSIDLGCMNANKQDFSATLNPSIPNLFPVPNCPTTYEGLKVFKIRVRISLGAILYNTYGYLIKEGNLVNYCSITYKYDKLGNRLVYSIFNPNHLNINWEKEFPVGYELLNIKSLE